MKYTSTILGVTVDLLSYVLRENEEPDFNGTFESFNERAIACSPLLGPSFQADSRQVHQLLKRFYRPRRLSNGSSRLRSNKSAGWT